LISPTVIFHQNKKRKAKIADPFSENARPGRVFPPSTFFIEIGLK